MKSCTCATPGSPVEAPRPSLHDCDEPNKDLLAPTRLARKPSKLKVSLEVTRCRFGTASRQAAPLGYEDYVPQKDWTPIYHAVYHDREAALRRFLQDGVSPDVTEGAGIPLLCIAAACGHYEVAKILLDAGTQVNAVSKDKGETAMHVAVKGNRYDIIDLLLVHRIDLEIRTIHTGESALHYAAAKPNSLALVMKLLKFGARHDVETSEGRTPAAIALQAHNLHAAVAIINMARGKPKQLAKEKDMLLKHVEKTQDRSSMTNDLIADVFAATCDPDSTVLIEAIKKNDARLVEMFLEKGADPHRATANGLSPMIVAVEFADLPIIKLLVQHSADVTVTGPRGLTVLQMLLAASSAREEGRLVAIIDYLLAKGADITTLYADGRTLLHQVANTSFDYGKIAKLLLKNGIDIGTRDGNGNTAIHLAASNGLEHVTRALLDAHADVTTVNTKRRTPLLCAVRHQRWSIVPLLAITPAINLWDTEGSTALHHIARSAPADKATWKDVAAAAKPFCERGVCRSMRDRSGATPLIQAIRTLPEDGLPVVEVLLTEGGKDRNCVGHEDHKRHDALHYAATLGKPVFVEILLKHGAPLVLEEWADGTRPFKLPAASKGRIMEIIIESNRLRQAQASQKKLDSIQETRIEIIKTEPRSNSAMSGYRADSEMDGKPKPNRNNVRKVASLQHLQVPSHFRKPAAPSPTFPARSSSRPQRTPEPTGHHPPAPTRPIVRVPSPNNAKADQTMLMNARPRVNQISYAKKAPSSQPPAPAYPPRAANRQPTTTLPTIPQSPPSTAATINISLLQKQPLSIAKQPSKDLPAIPKADPNEKAPQMLPQTRAIPVMTTVTSTPVRIADHMKPSATTATSIPKETIPATAKNVTVTPPEPSSATTAAPTTAKPVQPARVDSGVSLTQEDSTAKLLPALDRTKITLDSSTPKTKRQSGDELAGWLAISNMLDKL